MSDNDQEKNDISIKQYPRGDLLTPAEKKRMIDTQRLIERQYKELKNKTSEQN